MTVSASEALANGPYAGNGVTTVFDYDFKIYAQSELIVTRKNADLTFTTLALSVDYSVTGVGVAGGGTIVLVSATLLPVGTSLTIEPNITPSQDRAFSAQSSISLAEIEASLDKVTSLTRQLLGLRSRLLIAPVGEAGGTLDLGTAGQVLIADGAGGVYPGPDVNLIVTPPVTSARFLPNKANPDYTTRPDLTALQQGDLYFNTTTNKMRVYSGGGFTDAATGMSGANNLSELTNIATALATLTLTPMSPQAVLVTDMDAVINNGFYRHAPGALNSPVAGAAVAMHIRYDANSMVQFLQQVTGATPEVLYMRRRTGGVWQPWVAMVNEQQRAMTLATAAATVAGTEVFITGIPTWAREVDVYLDGVSGSLAGTLVLQLGTTGSVENTGYLSTENSGISSGSTNGFVADLASADAMIGIISLRRVSAGDNVWVAHGVIRASTTSVFNIAGNKTLAGALSRIRLALTAGVFDAGRVNIAWR